MKWCKTCRMCAALRDCFRVYSFIRKPRCSLVNRLLNHIFVLNCLRCFPDLKVPTGLIFKFSVTHQTGKKRTKTLAAPEVDLFHIALKCFYASEARSAHSALTFAPGLIHSGLIFTIWVCRYCKRPSSSRCCFSQRLRWGRVEVLGCWTVEPHKSNLFWTGEPERGGEVREGKDLMKGLRGEAENGGRSPSSVLFGCVAATVAAFESHAWLNPAR